MSVYGLWLLAGLMESVHCITDSAVSHASQLRDDGRLLTSMII